MAASSVAGVAGRWLGTSLVVFVGACSDASPDDEAALLGGETTVFDTTAKAYALPARNLSAANRDAFAIGDHLFNRNWVTAPASTADNDGLGPTFNATSCSSCHLRDGRGAPPQGDEAFLGLLLRLASTSDHDEVSTEPTYGGQLNHQSILGVPAEGNPVVVYEEQPGVFADGEPYSLRRPAYRIDSLAFGPLRPGTTSSPRIAPAMIGLGLLQAIDVQTIVAEQDEDDRDGDGISGRANWIVEVRSGELMLGRFGWKANQPTLEQQSAGAFLGDIGITTKLFPEENCPPAQSACVAAHSGGTPASPELSDEKLAFVVQYAAALAVPARRDLGSRQTQQGEQLFRRLGCVSCHRETMTTGTLAGFAEFSGQTIRPYTDLLLHDMGEGLADHQADHRASGSEWRTPPLWGLGLLQTVSRHEFLLHDGRARGVQEAILWHGGEGQAANDAFVASTAAERQALLAFLASL